LKTFLLIGFMLMLVALNSCGQKGDLIRPQQASEQSAEPQDEQNEQDEQDEQNEQDEQDKN